VGDEIVLKLGNTEYDWAAVGIILMTTRGLGYAPFDYVSHIKKAHGLASTLLIKTEEEGGQFQSSGMVGTVVLTDEMLTDPGQPGISGPPQCTCELNLRLRNRTRLFDRPLGFSFSLMCLTVWLAIVMIAPVVASLPAHRAMIMSVQEALAYK